MKNKQIGMNRLELDEMIFELEEKFKISKEQRSYIIQYFVKCQDKRLG